MFKVHVRLSGTHGNVIVAPQPEHVCGHFKLDLMLKKLAVSERLSSLIRTSVCVLHRSAGGPAPSPGVNGCVIWCGMRSSRALTPEDLERLSTLTPADTDVNSCSVMWERAAPHLLQLVAPPIILPPVGQTGSDRIINSLTCPACLLRWPCRVNSLQLHQFCPQTGPSL